MFDTIQQFISLFRCDFCSELIPLKGSPEKLRGNRVYLVTDDPRKYLKHYELEESLHMSWVVCCSECFGFGSMGEYLIPTDRVIKHFSPHREASTYDALRQTMKDWGVTPHLQSEVMIAAHFVGDRPVI